MPNLSTPRPQPPFFLAIAIRLLALVAAIGTPALIAIVVVLATGDGPYTLNGEPVEKARFLRFVIPFALTCLVAFVLAGATAWSIYRGRRAARPQLIAFLVLPVLTALLVPSGPDAPPALVEGVLPWLIVPVIAWLYLYRRRNVTSYYADLAERTEREAESRGSA